MVIRYEDVASEDVPLPAAPEKKSKGPAEKRMTLVDRLNALELHKSIWRGGIKKAGVVSQVSRSLKEGELSGKFQIVEYDVGGDSVHKHEAGVRIWRTEAGNVHQMAAE